MSQPTRHWLLARPSPRTRRRRSALAWAVLLAISGLVVTPGVSGATPNPFGAPSAWSVPVSRAAEVVPQADGGVIANTAIGSGGVPTGGDSLVGITSGGAVRWGVPYVDQEVIDPPNLVTDNRGHHYWIDSNSRIIASSGSTELWSKLISGAVGQHLAVGANGDLYDFESDNTLHGYDATDGHDIFPAVKADGLNGVVTSFLAYDKGLIVVSLEQVTYFDLSGRLIAGPTSLTQVFGLPVNPTAAETPNGDLFIGFQASGLSSPCSAPDAQTKVVKFTPAGLVWTAALSSDLKCNYTRFSGVDVNVTPDGGVVVSGASISGSRMMQHVTGDGRPDWLTSVPNPANTGDNVFFAPRVDEHGQIVLAQRFGFDCNLRSDSCIGVQLDRLGPDGKPVGSPILLMGSATANQQTWSIDYDNGLALTPGRAVLALMHSDSGRIFGNATRSVDAFDLPGLGAQYPDSALWKLMPGSSSPSPPPAPEANYVAIGDSFSSGEGTGDYIIGTDSTSLFDTCHRSPHAYGPLLAGDKSLGAPVFKACSGAVTDDMYVANPFNPNEPAQFSNITSSTRIATFTIGGNDADFVHLITKCVDGLRFPGTPEHDVGAWGCSTKGGLQRTTTARLALLSGGHTNILLVGRQIHSLSDVFSRIHAAAPKAQIYVGGYPRLFGNDPSHYHPTIAAPSGKSCVVARGPTGLRYSVDLRDALWLDGLADRLDTVIRQQVQRASASGVPVHYVAPAFTGHGLCDKGPSWINPLIINNLQPSPGSFHPTVTGQVLGYESQFKVAIP